MSLRFSQPRLVQEVLQAELRAPAVRANNPGSWRQPRAWPSHHLAWGCDSKHLCSRNEVQPPREAGETRGFTGRLLRSAPGGERGPPHLKGVALSADRDGITNQRPAACAPHSILVRLASRDQAAPRTPECRRRRAVVRGRRKPRRSGPVRLELVLRQRRCDLCEVLQARRALSQKRSSQRSAALVLRRSALGVEWTSPGTRVPGRLRRTCVGDS